MIKTGQLSLKPYSLDIKMKIYEKIQKIKKTDSKPQLLATLGTSESLSRQNTIDSQVLNEQSNNLNLAQCKQTSLIKKISLQTFKKLQEVH